MRAGAAALVAIAAGGAVAVFAYQAQAKALRGSVLALPEIAALDRALESPAVYGALALIERMIPIGPSAEELTMTADEQNVAAFLQMIRAAEGTAGPNGYRTLFGGRLFDQFADHPRIAVTAPLGASTITSTAAGAYQILARTWDEARDALELPDFSPASQDAAAVWLIRRRGALADVRAGRFDDALAKVAKEWASLPGAPYGQPVKTLDQARSLYASAGGSFA
jgi:muramidase (phage lysozyme)